MDNFGDLQDNQNGRPTVNLATEERMPKPKKFPFTRSWADMENNDANSSSKYYTNEQSKFRARTPEGVVEKLFQSGPLTMAKPEDIELVLDESKNPSSNNKMVHMIKIKEMSLLPFLGHKENL